jgi:hypothetical protein
LCTKSPLQRASNKSDGPKKTNACERLWRILGPL